MSDTETRRILEAKLKLLKLKAQKEEVENTNKTAFWKPFPHQQRALDFLDSGKQQILIQGGNRIGKTVFGSNVVASAVLGKKMWNGQPSNFPAKGGRVRILCSDWEHHAGEVIVPALKEWLPKGSYTTKKNNTGVEAFWAFPATGWTLELMTHSQDTQIHEGWKGHLVWADEPLPRDKYIANRRGLIDYSGVFLLTMTAVSESWILDEIVLSKDPSIGCITEIPMRANPLLKEKDIQSFETILTEAEKVARIEGGWLNLIGRVLSGFNKDIHVIKPFKVPPDYPCVALIDIAMNKPQAIGYYAWDKYDREYVIGECFDNMPPEEIANEIIRFKQANSLRMKNAYIDPLAKGDSAYLKNRYTVEDTFNIIERKLRPFGIRLHVASKDKNSGVRNLEVALKGINGMPTLYFFDTTHQHIWEIMRWTYDTDGKPKKSNDDMMENLYRSTLCGVKYTDPEKYTSKLQLNEVGVV